MKRCAFCTAEVPDEALKCKHCGEWADGRPRPGDEDGVRTVNVNWHMSEAHLKFLNVVFAWHAIAGAVGLAVFLTMVFVFFLPEWSHTKQEHDQFRKDVERRQKEVRGR